MNDRVNIDDRYPPEGEIRECSLPYEGFYEMLSRTFMGMAGLTSFCDVGCSNGFLLNEVKKRHLDASVTGIEYFSYHKDAAPDEVKNDIRICDLRDPFDDTLGLGKYDVIVCTEVGEHIDPEYATAFLSNIHSLMHKGTKLIMSWSDTGGVDDPESDPKHQHLNPLKRDSFLNLMLSSGFKFMSKQSQDLVVNSYKSANFYDWWRKSLTVWTINDSASIDTDHRGYDDLMDWLSWHLLEYDSESDIFYPTALTYV